jgi:hypothetical protein
MPYWKQAGGLLAACWLLLPWTASATVPEEPAAAKPVVKTVTAAKPAAKTVPAAKKASTWKPAAKPATAVKKPVTPAAKAGTAAVKKPAAKPAAAAKKPAAKKPAAKVEYGPYKAGDTKIPAPAGPVEKGDIIARAGRVIRNKNYLLPAGYQHITIAGKAEATKNQAVRLILSQTPILNIGCSAGEIVKLYWEEAEREGIRPDMALAQALVETGFFHFGGDVKPWQHNFCGLGTTGGGVRGAAFKTPQDGVRAHIQHLVAYSRKDGPKTAVIDPRFKSARAIRLQQGLVTKWYGLNMTWAMGTEYAEKIFTIQQRMLLCEDSEPKDTWHDYRKMEKEYEKIYEDRKKHGWASPKKNKESKTALTKKGKKSSAKSKAKVSTKPYVSTRPVSRPGGRS